jgi:hypothetical protein
VSLAASAIVAAPKLRNGSAGCTDKAELPGGSAGSKTVVEALGSAED